MTTNRQLWKEHISADYKQIPPFIVDWLLDIYEQNPEWFAQQTKQDKKKAHKMGSMVPPLQDEEVKKPEFYELNNVKIISSQSSAPPQQNDNLLVGTMKESTFSF